MNPYLKFLIPFIVMLALMGIMMYKSFIGTATPSPAIQESESVNAQSTLNKETKIVDTKPEVLIADTSKSNEGLVEKVAPKSTDEAKPAPAKVAPESPPMTAAQLQKATQIIEQVEESKVAALDTRKLYKTNCAICHGFKGDLGLNGAKDLIVSDINMQNRVAQIYFGKGLMTPFKTVLSEEEIVGVAKYIERLRK